MENQKNKSIGAFWAKVSKNLNKYYSGNIEIDGKKINLVMFENENKKDNQPDMRIYISEQLKSQEPQKTNQEPF